MLSHTGGLFMKKRIPFSTFCAIVACSFCVVSLPSCKKNKSIPHSKDGKALINIGTYNGGVGSEWINKICADLKEQFADYVDPELEAAGLKGVDFRVDVNESHYGENLESGLPLDIYFTEMVDYAYYAKKGLFMDVTDVVTSSLSEFGDTGTIEDKLDDNFKTFLKCIDNKYYGLPFYEGFYNLMYDVDLFDKEYLFFNEDGDIGETSSSNNLSKGPDNVAGTWDDGLPSTYEQFDVLMDNLSGSYTPIVLTGGTTNYVNRYIQNHFVNYEGKEQSLLNYNFNGTATHLGTVEQSGSSVVINQDATPTAISQYSEGAVLQKQLGKYYALDFLKNHMMNGSLKTASSHLQAQKDFISTKYGNNQKEYAYGLLVEGSWWENEAGDYLKADESKGGGKLNRRFGILPIPKVSEAQLGEKQTVISLNSSFCFVSKDACYPELTKQVFKFFHTNKSLSSFTTTTSTTRAFSYTIEDSDAPNCSYYAKQLLAMKKTCDIVYPYSSDNHVLDKKTNFSMDKYPWSIGVTTSNVFDQFNNNLETPVSYFKKMYTYATQWWNK